MADRAPLNTAGIVAFPVSNATVPQLGPRCVPLFPDFTAAASYLIDMTQMIQLKQIDSVQSIFIDNSGGAVPVTLQVGISKQIVVLPPFSQGVLPMFVPNPPQFTVTSNGNTYQVQLIATNMPLPYMVWNSRQSTSQYNGSGAQSVSDAALEAGVVGGFYQSQEFAISGLQAVVARKIGSVPFLASLTASSATVIPATASLGWYINAFEISLTPNATAAAAGPSVITLADGATTIWSKTVQLPAAATNLQVVLGSLSGIQLNSKALNQALTLKSSVALTAGAIEINLIGGKTTDIS